MITPETLEKVIEIAGGKEVVKKKLNVKEKIIEKWLNGEKQPTFKQLEKLSKISGILLGDLIRNKIPDPLKTFNMVFYRRDPSKKPSSNLIELVRLLNSRVNFLNGYLEELGYEKCKFVNSISLHDDIENVAKKVVKEFNIDIKISEKSKTKEKYFNYLKTQLEKKQIFVFLGSYLNNNTRATLLPEEFKGISIADEFAPCIFINTNTYKSVQIFTLIHELIHILLGENAISDIKENDLEFSTHEVEIFCNKVAGAVLVPEEYLSLLRPNPTIKDFQEIAEKLKISPLVVMIRAYEKGLINQDILNRNFKEYKKLFKKIEQEKKEVTGYADWYAVKIKQLSSHFLKFAISALNSATLLPNHFVYLTGIKFSKLSKIEKLLVGENFS